MFGKLKWNGKVRRNLCGRSAGQQAKRITCRRQLGIHALDGANLCMQATLAIASMVLRGSSRYVPSDKGNCAVFRASAARIKSIPGRIRPPRKFPPASSQSTVVAVPAQTTRQSADRSARAPINATQRSAPKSPAFFIGVAHPALTRAGTQPEKWGKTGGQRFSHPRFHCFASHIAGDNARRIRPAIA